MRSVDEHSIPAAGSADRELKLLAELHRNPEASQRELSCRVGIALGMTNLLLHNLAEKGYLRITKAKWRSWLYVLTPEGLLQKVRLTLSYIDRFLSHYQMVRQTLREELAGQPLNAESRVALYGTGEFAELVYLGLKELGIEEMGVFDGDGKVGSRFLGMPVQDFSAFRPEAYDMVVIAALNGTEHHTRVLLSSGVALEKLVTFFNNPSFSLIP